jgi:ribonuclease VapC
MSAWVLDASALLALLKNEPGSAQVVEVLAESRISVVNLAEVVSHFVQLGMPPHEVDAMLKPLPLVIVEADQGLAVLAGQLRTATSPAGLSLGDRFCLALALRDGLPAMTADKQWLTIADAVGVQIVTIR